MIFMTYPNTNPGKTTANTKKTRGQNKSKIAQFTMPADHVYAKPLKRNLLECQGPSSMPCRPSLYIYPRSPAVARQQRRGQAEASRRVAARLTASLEDRRARCDGQNVLRTRRRKKTKMFIP